MTRKQVIRLVPSGTNFGEADQIEICRLHNTDWLLILNVNDGNSTFRTKAIRFEFSGYGKTSLVDQIRLAVKADLDAAQHLAARLLGELP